jgi:quercetin dioxygenase-like cupin family protein
MTHGLLRKARCVYCGRVRIRWLAAACLILVCPGVGLLAQKNEITILSVERRELFTGAATLMGKQRRSREVRAAMVRWLVPPRQRIAEFPEHAFLLIQMRGGTVTTVIDGKEERHVTGDFWVVRAGAKMSVECFGEAATFDVMTLSVP